MSLNLPIYLDNAATTKVDPRVVAKMLPFLSEKYGNPASNTHSFGIEANTSVENARQQVATTVGCDPKEIIWTSGATEAINLALKGAALFYQNRGRHLITIKTEHKATLDTLKELEHIGYDVTYLAPEETGLLDLNTLISAIRPDTILVSIAFVNSEIGVIQDIATIGNICNEKNILLHVDAAQAVGKIDFNLANLNVSLMSFSAHKVYGPKGIGALYIRRHPRVRLVAQIHGGGHERGFRSGTLPSHQIIGMGEAFMLAKTEFETEIIKIRCLRDTLLLGLKKIDGFFINGSLEQRVLHNLNIGFTDIDAKSLMEQLQKDIAISAGSACTSLSLEPSYILRAIGLDENRAYSSLRITLGRFNLDAEMNYVVKLMDETINKLRTLHKSIN